MRDLAARSLLAAALVGGIMGSGVVAVAFAVRHLDSAVCGLLAGYALLELGLACRRVERWWTPR